MKREDTNVFSYDAAVKEIESIVDKLENHDGDGSFDCMIIDVEKAMGLLALCKKNISDAEKKLTKLSKSINEEK